MQQSKEHIGKYILELIRTLAIAIIITLVLVLLSAFIIKSFNVPTQYISIINQVTKGISILISALLSLRMKNAGYLRGLVLGVCYILLTYLVFSLFSGEFSSGLTLLNDIVLGAVSGLLSGIIAVNLRK